MTRAGADAGGGEQEIVAQDLILREVGPYFAVVTEAVRSMLGIEMAAAQALIARAPVALRERISPALAEALRGKLVPLGATVEIRPHAAAEHFDVLLEGYGGSKIEVVRAVKMALDLELREAIELIDEAPTVVRRKASRADAEALRDALVGAGARVEVRPHEPTTPEPAIRASAPPPSPTQPVSAAPVSAAPVSGEARTFRVVLHDDGGQKIAVIRAIRVLTGLSLKESKDLAETPDAVVTESASEAEARAFEREVKAVGGRVTIYSNGGEPLSEPSAADSAVVMQSCGPHKIDVIKLIRELTALGLADAKALSETPGAAVKEGLPREEAEAIAQRFIALGASVEVREGGASPESAKVDVFLESCGPTKIRVLKVVRELLGLGLKEVKDLVESAPCVLKEQVALEVAHEWREQLVAAGATVELR